MQKFLQLVRQLVRAHGAHPLEHGLVTGKLGIGMERGVEIRIGNAVQLQREEHKRRGRIGHAVLRVGHVLCARGIHRVLVIAQTEIGHQPPGDLFDPFVAHHAAQQRGGIQPGQLAFVIGGKIRAFLFQPVEIARDFGRVL